MNAAPSLSRTIMASPKEGQKVLEGIFAINKPQWKSSAGVLRDLQTYFHTAPLFAPWLTHTRRNLIFSQAKSKHIKKLSVKLGHGGTLDPLATGVLVVGVGKGTKCLQRFLECTKTYECVVLFGAATDSYDAVGKLVSRAEYKHVTKELVEDKLRLFRGRIMQEPSVFSALKVDGKKMYEYAREGGYVPKVAARPVEVHDIELVEWLEPGTHGYTWPEGEPYDGAARAGVELLLASRVEAIETDEEVRQGFKRLRTPDDLTNASESDLKRQKTENAPEAPGAPSIQEPHTTEEADDHVSGSQEHPKPPKMDTEPAMSGALPVEQTSAQEQPAEDISAREQPAEDISAREQPVVDTPAQPQPTPSDPPHNPPAARLRMTVTSGFYVRSLCHDLGLACSSLGLMSSLIRSRQGDYELGKNVLEYADLEAGPDMWQPKLQASLETFMEQEGWAMEEVGDDEAWEAKRKEEEEQRRERSNQGSGQRNGNRKGKGGRR